MSEFTMSPQTSVTDAVKLEKAQLDRIEAKLDHLIENIDKLITVIIRADEGGEC